TITTPSTQPTPSPTHSPIGPEGTVLIQDGKAWLESKDGTYTIDIPQGFEPHEPTERSNGNPFLQSTSDKQAVIAFTPRLDLRSVPSRQQIKDALSNTLTNEPQIRDDLTVFAGQPAITTQFKVIPWGENDHAGYDGTILSLFTEIGGTRWGLSFTGSNPSEAENLMQQAADSLTKQ
ncbi:hypothetical protein, partial [Buchananella hordeovulneris]|uniref:hypothetical protein n=2 Tax=Buchananella hordeovulneris TaxID=52770 RepID=UPI00163AD147